MRLHSLLLLSLAAMPLVGCGYTQNVRAYRAYAYESPSLNVALDRTEDLAAALELVDRLLTQTPYSPDDKWVEKIALKDAEAAAIRDEIRQKPPYDANNSYEIPVVKLYRVHLTRVLDEARGSKGKFPSLLDAMGALGGDSAELKAHWAAVYEKSKAFAEADEAYNKAVKEHSPKGQYNPLNVPPAVLAASKVRDDAKDELRAAEKKLEADVESIKKGGGDLSERATVLAAATAGVSVAYRIELEALAMLPIIAVQVIRSLPKAGEELTEKVSISGVRKLADVPDHIDAIKEKMSRQARLLDMMTSALAEASKTTIEATAGFALKESVVDQVVGVTFESFRAQAKAGGEAFFFNALKQDDKSQQQNQQSGATISKDLTGRQRALVYSVKPILFTAFNLNVGFDYINLPDAANLSFGFKTDRVFSSGGSIEKGSFADQLGVKGFASDALDLGLGILGVKTNVRLATFTTGTVRYTDVNDGATILNLQGQPTEAPLQINYTQIDAGYDIAFLLGEKAKKYYIEELTVGFRYFKYELPRILYELENQLPSGSQDKNFTYFNETHPQTVPSRYYMGGLTARASPGDAPMFAPYFDLGFYIGGGPTSYFLRPNKAVACNGTPPAAGTECIDDPAPENPATTSASAFAFDLSAALGLKVRLVKPGRRFRLNGEILYRAELIYANATGSSSDTGKEHQIDFGTADVFHGPRFNLVGDF